MDLYMQIYPWINWSNMDRDGNLKPELDDGFQVYGPLKEGAPKEILMAYEEFNQQEKEAREEGIIID